MVYVNVKSNDTHKLKLELPKSLRARVRATGRRVLQPVALYIVRSNIHAGAEHANLECRCSMHSIYTLVARSA